MSTVSSKERPPALFDGVRVIELAQFVFVPSVGMAMADWGAEVIKIEHPVRGDGYRGLATSGIGTLAHGANVSWEMVNRGKRSIGLDVGTPDGRQILLELIRTADVFMTGLIPAAIERLDLGVDVVRAANPSVIYARGHGLGVRGPDADKPAYDATAFWARGGLAEMLTPPGQYYPVGQRPAFGDRNAASQLAFGIAAALYRRATTGQPTVVDVSLLSTAMWTLTADLMSALQGQQGKGAPPGGWHGREAPNPLTNNFRTKDARWIALVLLQPDRYWKSFCEALGRQDLADDPRFGDVQSRARHKAECSDELERMFLTRTYAEWCSAFADAKFPWAPAARPAELLDDPQVLANGYIGEMHLGEGQSIRLPTGAIQFDGLPPELVRAPEHGQHTEEVLLDIGMTWDDIERYKQSGAIL